MAGTVAVKSWSHVGIRVHDLETSTAFYSLLGFELTAGPIGPEPVAILHHPGGMEINLVLNAADDARTNLLMDVEVKHPGITHLALVVDSVDQAREVLEAAGHRITEVMNIPGMTAMFVRDPDGNVIELDERVG